MSKPYLELGGYKRWSEGDAVTFYWFDGRNLDKINETTNAKEKDGKCDEKTSAKVCLYEKMAMKETTLKYDASKNAFQLAIGATAIIFTAVTFAF